MSPHHSDQMSEDPKSLGSLCIILRSWYYVLKLIFQTQSLTKLPNYFWLTHWLTKWLLENLVHLKGKAMGMHQDASYYRTPDSEGHIPLDHFSRFVHSQLICRVSVSMTIWKIFNFLFGPNEAWWNSGHCPGNSCTCFGFHTWLWLVRPLNTSALLLVRKCTLYFWYGDALRIKIIIYMECNNMRWLCNAWKRWSNANML